MTLSCFIIDDEPLALGLIESYVRKTPFLALAGKFYSAVEAAGAVRDTPPDVIFLDIQMAEMNGMEFARIVPPQTRIIFTTAFQQYALDSYRVNALDYLLKPFGYTDFLQAANKALHWFEMKRKADAPPAAPEGTIFVKADYKLMQIAVDDIIYIEGLKDYVKIYTEGAEKPIVSHITMKTLEETLPPGRFMRTHRSYIVNTGKIREVEHNRIVFGKTRVPISEGYKEAFQQFLDGKLVD